MNSIEIQEIPKITSPNPVTLICTERPDGDTNLAAISWWTFVSYEPPLIGIAMSRKGYSGERLAETGRCLLTVPSEEIAKSAFLCGTVSGRDKNKAVEFGIELRAVENSKIKAPVHSRLVVDCAMQGRLEIADSDHYFYICRPERAFADENKTGLFAWNGYGYLAPALHQCH